MSDGLRDHATPRAGTAAVDGFRCRAGGEALAVGLFERWPQQAGDHAILLVDAAVRIVAVNGAAETMFAGESGALLDLPLSALFTDRDRALGLDRQEFAVAGRLGASEDDRWHRRLDGTEFWSLGTLRTIRDPEDPSGGILGYVKLIRDRTDLRAQIDTTAHRLAAAEAALAASDRRLATAGHELRGAIGTIGNAVLALRQADLPTDKVDRLHEIVERQMEIARRLLRDAVDGAGEETGALDAIDVALQPILESAADTVRRSPLARDRTIELIVPDEPLRLVVDPVRVEQVVRNLIENACKYNAPGGHVWVTATLEGEDAVLRVRDDGIGIGHDLLPRIFEWFVRGDDAGAGSAEGFGIGLGVVRDLVRRLHGTVEVVSSGAGGGSEFTVNLPLRPPVVGG